MLKPTQLLGDVSAHANPTAFITTTTIHLAHIIANTLKNRKPNNNTPQQAATITTYR